MFIFPPDGGSISLQMQTCMEFCFLFWGPVGCNQEMYLHCT